MKPDRAVTAPMGEGEPANVTPDATSRAGGAVSAAMGLAGMLWVGFVCLGAASLLSLAVVRVGFDLWYGIDPFLPPARRPFIGAVQLAHRAFAVDALRQIFLAAFVIAWAAWRQPRGWHRRLALDRERPNGLRPVVLLAILLFWPVLHIAWVSGTGDLFGASVGKGVRLSPFMDRTAVVAWLVYVSVLAPVAEELLVRGEMFHRARSALGPAWAVTVTALVFAAAHVSTFGLARPVSLLPLAFTLGWLRWKTGRLWPSIALHGWSNLALIVYLLWPR